MNTRSDGWPYGDGHAEDAQAPGVITGEVWHQGTYPPQAPPEAPMASAYAPDAYAQTYAQAYTQTYAQSYVPGTYAPQASAPQASVPETYPPETYPPQSSGAPPQYAVIHRPYDGPSVPYAGGTVPYDERTLPYDGVPHDGPAVPQNGGGSHSRSVRPPWVRPSRRRRVARLLALLLCALLVVSAGTFFWADFKLNRKVNLSTVAHRPPQGKGTTYLVVGSDSRNGLSASAKKNLHTGPDEGARTDSMILLHTGAHGTTMVSLPRDSWVTLPAFTDPDTGERHRQAKNKLNAAYSLGGPRMLVKTIELNTGLRVDHYAEIGFAGFVGMVNAVGGVPICLDRSIKDPKSGENLKKGCHNLDGSKALAFVRQRHQEANGDLGRSKNQQKFLSALARKTAAPGTALDPLRSYPAASAGLGTLVVDKDMRLRSLFSLFQATRRVTSGHGKQLNVPVSGIGIATSKGSAVKWDATKARTLFGELKSDSPVTVKGKKG